MDDNELEEIELSDDELSDGLDVDGSNYINSQANSAPSFSSNNQSSNKSIVRQQIDNKINNVGTEALKKMGVPEPLAKQAIKKNGGTFSPTNMPANKLASNSTKNKLASGLSKVGGSKLKALQTLNSLSKTKQNGKGILSETNSSKEEAVKNETESSSSDKAKNVAKAVFDLLPPNIKIKIYIVLAAVSLFFLIILIIVTCFSKNKYSDTGAIASYLSNELATYQGKNYDIKGYLIEAGYCDEDDCEDSNAYKYITKVNDWLSQYNSSACRNNNYKLDEAINLIVSTATYEREVEDYYGLDISKEEYEKQLEIYLEEYQKLTENSFSSEEVNAGENGAITCYKFLPESYKSYVVSEEGYLDTYRDDLGELTEEEKNSVYDVITGDAEEVKITIEESKEIASSSGIVSGGTSMIISSVCTGVTVTGENAGVYSLDEYIAGVIENENNWYRGDNIENMKAQAVAARTYLLRKTNNCKGTIENSTSSQTFNPNPSEKARQAAIETSNQVLVNNDGSYISAEYDAFALKEKTEEFYILKQAGLQIPVDWVDEHISSSTLDYYEKHHHGRGMSQWGSRYLQTLGYTYDEILSTFYENSTLKTLGNSVTSNIPSSRDDLQGRHWFTYDINDYIGGVNFGQCVWYAKHRAMEILATSPVDESMRQTLIQSIKATPGNGIDWYKSPNSKYFKKSTDINQPKAGSIVSWAWTQEKCKRFHGVECDDKHINYGHVAIVEAVYTDSNGQIMVTLTEGWRSGASGGGWSVTNNLWSVVNVKRKELTLQQLKNYSGIFNGYVYLY